MYTLFNNPRSIRQTNVTVFGLDYVRKVLMDTQMDRYKQYRGMSPGYLKSDHILMRILQSINVEFVGDLPDYYLQVGQIVNRMAGQMGLVTAAHRGKVIKDGYFYGKGISEILIANSNDEVTIADIWFNWRSLSSIRVLSHPVYGLDMVELDGSNPFTTALPGSIAVLEIDIPLLACQYQLWRMAVGTDSSGFVQPVQHFLTGMVIPNMLPSHLDAATVNTVHHLLGATDLVTGNSDMPFHTTDLWPRLSKGLGEVVERLTKQNTTYIDMLSNIPVFSVDGKNGLDVVKLPDIAHTNQAVWALTIARLPYIAMLLKIDAVSDNVRNDSEKNRIRRSLIEAESGKYLSNQIPKEVAEHIARYIDENIRPYL